MNDGGISSDRLQEAVRGGTRAVFVAQVLSQVVSIAVLAALYQLVAPEEFGLLGMVMPVLLLVRMLAPLGLNIAAVQRSRLSESESSALFWGQLLLGALGAFVVALCGPLLAWLYDAPELAPVCVALAGTLLVAALGAQHQTLLERRMQIGRLAGARLLAQTVGGLAGIFAALNGWGVWALIVQQYGELLMLDLAVWIVDPWRPSRPSELTQLLGLLHFGGHYSLSSLMFYLALNADKVLLAWLLGSSERGQAVLGLYTQAFNLMMKPVYLLTTPVTGIMLPALSRARSSPALYQQLVVGFYRMTGVVLMPAGVGLLLVAPDVMLVLGGPTWAEAGWILAAFAPAVIVQGFINIAGSVVASAGRADRLFHGSVVMAVVYLQGYLAGYWLAGQAGADPLGRAIGVAAAYSFVTLIVLAGPYLLYCFSVAGVPLSPLLRRLALPLLASLAMGTSVWLARQLLVGSGVTPVLRLLLLVLIGAGVYVVLARAEVRWLIGQLVQVRQRTDNETGG